MQKLYNLNNSVILIFLMTFLFKICLGWVGGSLGLNNLSSVNGGYPPKLLFRYAEGTSMFTVSENLQLLLPPTSNEKLGEVLVIRICSDKKLLPSIPSTTINPIQIANYLISIFGIKPSNIFLANSKDCVLPVKDRLYPVEIWNLEKGGELPLNSENYNFEQIKYSSLGFDPVDCPKNSSSKGVRVLIKKMLIDKNSFGAIVSYYLRKPSSKLTKRVKAIENLLKKNNISNSRYSITKQSWHDGDSACANEEPTQPMVIFITLNKQ